MLKITVNKDISEYSEGIYYGLTMKEIIRLIIAGIVTIMLTAVFSMFMPLFFAVYMSAPLMILIMFSGKKIGNMSIKEIISYYPVYKAMKKGVEYSSTENPDLSDLREVHK